MSRRNSPEDTQRVRISVQYRSKHGMVFELMEGANVLAVHITARRSSDDSGDWHVETRLGNAAGPALVDEWGTTPAEALRKAASTWEARIPRLTTFNWDAIATELHAVHAV